jgi:hypothetical protein
LCLFTLDATAGSQVGVYLDFDQSPSAIAAEAMRQEAGAALHSIGFDIAWRLVSENQGNEAFERLVVVKLAGKCACERSLSSTRQIVVLGSTEVSGGEVLPYSQVRCDQVRRVLPQFEFAANRQSGDAALGRALGRVLAHELYHVLLGTTHHSASGLAKAIQSIEDLSADEFSFELSASDRRHGDQNGLAADSGQPVNRVH